MIPPLTPVRRAGLALLGVLLAHAGSVQAQKLPDEMVSMERCPNEGLQPRVAQGTLAGVEGDLHVVYFLGDLSGGDLWLVSSKDEGRTFGEPVRVNQEPGIVDAEDAVRGARIHLGASGRLHVVWTGVTEYPEGVDPEKAEDSEQPRALWYTRSDGEGGFEPERRLAGETHLLDAAPCVVEGPEALFVFWHEPVPPGTVQPPRGPEPGDGQREDASDELPGRAVLMLQSTDGGESFGEPTPIYTEGYSVSDRCAMGAGVQPEDGTVYVAYQGQKDNKRDWRLLTSRNGGVVFRNRFMDNWGIPRKISTTATITIGTKALLVAYESYGKVWFTRIDPNKRRPLMPYAARDTSDWRGRPTVATNEFKVGLLTWIEGEKATEPARLVWQAFHLGERRNMGMGRVHQLPEGTSPAIFTRSDQSFCILY